MSTSMVVFLSPRWLGLLLLLSFLATLSSLPCKTTPPIQEVNALHALYNSTQGIHWTWRYPLSTYGAIWNFTVTNPNPCNFWQGITCTGSGSPSVCHVNDVSLETYNLQGSIPKSIGDLTQLTLLDLSMNVLLGGSVPSEIGNLVKLTQLLLDYNALTGTIPSTITNLQKLAIRYMMGNHFHGELPVDIGSMSSLVVVFLYDNYLQGTIPASITFLSKLAYLYLYDNHFHGPLPPALENLASLRNLAVSYNQLTGTIPSAITKMKALDILVLYGNYLNGSIPQHIGNVSTLYQLELSSNLLTGSLPDSLAQLQQMTYLFVYDNFLNGSIPAAIGNMSQLTQFAIDNNTITGTIPDSIVNLKRMQALYLYQNYLHGSIPEHIGNMSNLSTIAVNNNFLTGTIPSSIAKIKNLYYLLLNENNLHGTIPTDIGRNRRLVQLALDSNNFEGSIPASISNMTILSYLSLKYNQFTGVVPTMKALTTLSLGNNYFHDDLGWFYNVQHIDILQINNNLFTGSIPSDAFQAFVNITVFDSQNNMLSGSISDLVNPERQQMLNLMYFSNNEFTGSIPASMFQLPNLTYFAAAKNCFTGSIPSNVCDRKQSLQVLVLDGLHAAYNCQERLLPAIGRIHTLAASHSITGNIPDCVYTAMEKLEVLHLSGNELTGSLPDTGGPLGSQLQQLSLSHNLLTGTIPATFQSHPFVELDLSFNKLTGTLKDSMNITGYTHAVAYNSSGLSLNNNRLSGNIPAVLKNLPEIDILNGNLFDCASETREATLPKNDDKRNTYMCGSNETNSALITYVVLIFVGTILLALLFMPCSCKTMQHSSSSSSWSGWTRLVEGMHFLRDFLSLSLLSFNFVDIRASTDHDSTVSMEAKEIQSGSIQTFSQNIYLLCAYFIRLLAVSISVLLLSFGLLGTRFSSYTYKYVWSISIAYLSGIAPGVCLFFILACLLIWVFLDVRGLKPLLRYATGSHVTYARLYEVSQWLFLGCNMQSYHLATPERFASKASLSEDVSSSYHNKSRMSLDSVSISEVSESIEEPVAVGEGRRKLTWKNRGLLLVFFLVNITIVMTINASFVAAFISDITIQQQAMIAIGMSLFKDAWRILVMQSFELPLLKDVEDVLGGDVVTRILLSVCLFNNIIAPCIATALVDSNCFYYAVVPSSDVVSSYAVQYCQERSSFGACYLYEDVVLSTTYQPPFTYMYLCSSTLLSLFVPVWIFMFIFSGLIAPAVTLVMLAFNSTFDPQLYSSVQSLGCFDAILRLLVPLRYQSFFSLVYQIKHNQRKIKRLAISIIDARTLTILICNNFAIIMCFGVLFPPVAVVGVISLLSQTLLQKASVLRVMLFIPKLLRTTSTTRFSSSTLLRESEIDVIRKSGIFQDMRDDDDDMASLCTRFMEEIERQCDRVPYLYMKTTRLVVVYVSVVWGMFLWDIVGDAVGFWASMWTFVLMVVCGVLVRYLNTLSSSRDYLNRDLNTTSSASNSVDSVVVGMEMRTSLGGQLAKEVLAVDNPMLAAEEGEDKVGEDEDKDDEEESKRRRILSDTLYQF